MKWSQQFKCSEKSFYCLGITHVKSLRLRLKKKPMEYVTFINDQIRISEYGRKYISILELFGKSFKLDKHL